VSDSTYDQPGGSGTKSVRWSAVGLAGRQGLTILLSIVLANLLGPEAFGIIAQATVYMALTSLLLDQGISAALISSKSVHRVVAGAATTVNILLALVFGASTLVFAYPISVFFSTPELVGVLWVLGMGLVLKAFAVVPRMLAARQMSFRSQAIADIAGTIAGGTVALLGAHIGWGYWALVWQVIATDLVTAVILIVLVRPPRPNFKLNLLRETLGFSSRVMTGNLISFTVQNIDTVLIGRYMSALSVAYYSLAYRVLTTPVQMIGQVVTRVLFPAISRARHRDQPVAPLIYRSVQSISLISFPLMAFIAVSSRQSVPIVLGDEWLAVIPILAIFAISGARQSVTTINTSVMMGMGRADITLKFSFVAAAVQVSGIVIGLQYGIVGVAVGFTVAGFALTPVICVLQKRIASFEYRHQALAVLPAIHASVWSSGAYLLFTYAPMPAFATLALGGLIFVVVYAAILLIAHRRTFQDAMGNVRSIIGR
jgi:PST family polysaccharide transporter